MMNFTLAQCCDEKITWRQELLPTLMACMPTLGAIKDERAHVGGLRGTGAVACGGGPSLPYPLCLRGFSASRSSACSPALLPPTDAQHARCGAARTCGHRCWAA